MSLKLKNKKRILISLMAFLVFAVTSGLFIHVKYPYFAKRSYNYVVRLLNEPTSTKGGSGKSAQHNIRVRDAYPLHLAAGQQYGWSPIANRRDLLNLKSKNKLVEVHDNQGYALSCFTKSSQLLTQSANAELINIGQQFANKAGADNYFTVTSMTRTTEQQNKLSATNNAATKGISSHSYGCSFDISYIRFNGKKAKNKQLQAILESILLDLRKQHKLLIIAETSSHCYHITVIKD